LRERETERERKSEAKRGSKDEREKVSEWVRKSDCLQWVCVKAQ
jgi:hypothetical protein